MSNSTNAKTTTPPEEEPKKNSSLNERESSLLAFSAYHAQEGISDYKTQLEGQIRRLSSEDIYNFYRDIQETKSIVKEIEGMLTARL